MARLSNFMARHPELSARLADLKYTMYLLRRNPLVLTGSLIALLFIVLSLISNLIVDPSSWRVFDFAKSYGWNNPIINWGPLAKNIGGAQIYYLGTDGYGRDLLKMIILAIPLDISIAFILTAGAAAIGVTIGALAGYVGGKIDEAILRITDIFFAFPGLVLALVFATLLGRTITTLMIALLIVWWPSYVRLTRGQVLSEKEKSYVEALIALGAGYPRVLLKIQESVGIIFNKIVSLGAGRLGFLRIFQRVFNNILDQLALFGMHIRILFRHILPNSIYPVLVQATLDIGGAILTFSALMFLGFSPSPALPELGNLAAEGIYHVFDAPWLIVFPGLTILLIALAFNLVGDGLRDVLDPRLRR